MNKLLQRIRKFAQEQPPVQKPTPVQQLLKAFPLEPQTTPTQYDHQQFEQEFQEVIASQNPDTAINFLKNLNLKKSFDFLTEKHFQLLDNLFIKSAGIAPHNNWMAEIYCVYCATLSTHKTNNVEKSIIAHSGERDIESFLSLYGQFLSKEALYFLFEKIIEPRFEYFIHLKDNPHMNVDIIHKFFIKTFPVLASRDDYYYNVIDSIKKLIKNFPDFKLENVINILLTSSTITNKELAELYSISENFQIPTEPIIKKLMDKQAYNEIFHLAEMAQVWSKGKFFPYDYTTKLFAEGNASGELCIKWLQGTLERDHKSKTINPAYFKLIQYKLLNNNDNDQNNEDDISILFHSSISGHLDYESLYNYIIKNKKYNLLKRLLPTALGKHDKYVDDDDDDDDFTITENKWNIPIIEKIVQDSKDPGLIGAFLHDYVNHHNKTKINYAVLKKQYNDIVSKNPKWVDAKLEDANRIINIVNKNYYNSETKVGDYAGFINELVSKKDWILLSMEYKIRDNYLIQKYLKEKNKTYTNLYHEVFKNNITILGTIYELSHGSSYWNETNVITKKLPASLPNLSNNFDQYVKLIERLQQAGEVLHDTGVSHELIVKAFLNYKFDLEDQTCEELLEIMNNLQSFGTNSEEALANILSKTEEMNKVKEGIIDFEIIQKNEKIVSELINKFNNNQSISILQWSPEHYAIKRLHTDLDMIEDFDAIKKYIKIAKPKDPKLMELELTLPNGFEFKILKSFDPRAFRVGAETSCCQRLNGAGAGAAIDSYINPLAGVLILEYRGMLLSQSYFHYVPEDKGVILDNVEHSLPNMKKIHIDSAKLSKIYADYAAALKEKIPEISYIKCGAGRGTYNKLVDDLFAWQSNMKKDPRHFEVEEHDIDPYSDFTHNNKHISLLDPIDELKNMPSPIPKPTEKRAQTYIKTLTASLARQIILQDIFS